MMEMAQFKDAYLSEAEDHLQHLNDNLLALEKNPTDEALLTELMRSSHTLKGSSAAMGYTKTAFLTHVMEDVFDGARGRSLNINNEIISILFNTVDILEKTIKSIKEKNEEIDTSREADYLKQITGVATEGVGKSSRAKSTDIKNEPEEVAPVALPQSTSAIEYIKVPVVRLDKLMALLEELLVDKMRIVELSKKNEELAPVANHLDRLVSDFQYQVMQTRMVPVGQVFSRFSRLVRDTAVKVDKKVDLRVVGADIELDRTIVDRLSDPLVHLLKNAVDHGIEKVGTIILSASREKDLVIISVENSGKEIDWENVRRAAVEHNVISEEDARHLDKGGLTELLYKGNLSTKEEITEISGRGVGLSVVKSFVEQNGGRVEVISPASKDGGVRFRMELPLSLSMVNVLIVEVSEELFAIPFSSIERTVRVPNEDIKSMADQEVAIVQGESIPLIFLNQVFARKVEGGDLPKASNRKSILAVILQHGEKKVGLVVDSFRDEMEIIIKPLSPVLGGSKGFSGSTVLGDGRTILIIDTASLLDNLIWVARGERT